jgi:CDP-glycerol glycerophosphotransferase
MLYRRFGRRSVPLVSLVVPVYGVERYLPACLDSLIEQTHSRLQIILIDDGSPDRSIDIMEAYAQRDSRIEIIRQANAGLGAARNTGARAARGEFLMFVDSDDTLELDAVETYVRSLRRTGSDFAVASYQRVSSAGTWSAAWWIRAAHRLSMPAVTLREFPDIQVNAVAWSKCYRRKFWERNQMAFPIGVLYEDQAVSSRAYVRASSFDVLSRVLHNWRVRDDRSSITQQLAEVKDLRARLDAAHASLAELDRPGFERPREVRLAHYLGNDFPMSIKAAQHGNDEFWEMLREGLTKLTAQITPDVWERVSAQHRVATELVIEDKRADVEWFMGLGHNNPKSSPTVIRNGRVYLDTEVRHALGMPLTDPLLALADHQLSLITATRRAHWTGDGRLEIEGWAYIYNVSLADVGTTVRAWCQEIDGPRSVPLDVAPRPTVDVTAASKHRYADYEKSGFVTWVDPRVLWQRHRSADRADWQVMIQVTSAGISRDGLLRGIDSSSSAGRLAAHFFGRHQAVPRYTTRDGLAIAITPIRCALDRANGEDRTLSVAVTGMDGFVPYELELRDPASDLWVREPLRRLAGDKGEGSLVLPLSMPDGSVASPGSAWTARIVSLAGARAPAAVVTDDAITFPPTTSPYPGRTLHQNLCIFDEQRSVWVESATVDDDGVLLISGGLVGVVAERLTFSVATPRARAVATATASGPSRFQAAVPLRHDPWRLGATVLPVGTYLLQCTEAAGARATIDVPVHAERAVIDSLPGFFATDNLRGQLRRARPDGLQLVLEAPLQNGERGARRQERLQLALKGRVSRTDYEHGSVLFRSYFGEVTACNPLAVHQELRRRGTRHTLYWAVADYSVAVPEGGIPVLHDSAEWYRLLHEAHFYMDNMHQPMYHKKPAHQIQIQTFHGYPFKQMGLSHWTRQNRDKIHVQSYLDRAKDWDYLVSPATYGTKALCEEFGFFNEVLEIGYPRNDVLLSAEAPQISASVRERLGIRPEQTVLLYAPTFRDEMAQNDFKASMVDFLDIPRLAAALGDDVMVLVRGHAFNARVDARVGSRGNVRDVTDYPNVADLCLASDAAILDYSSLRFDYALTGKPMIFMVPDLEQYTETSRGSLFVYEPTAPGPHVKTTTDVMSAARDLAAVQRDYADAYAAFQAEFLDLDDGHATERLVDAVFLRDDL